MRKLDNTINSFFEILRAGLWADHGSAPCSMFQVSSEVDYWQEIYQLAQEQTVVGLVAAGIEELGAKDSELRVPQEVKFQFIGQIMQIEQRNKAMNSFIAELIEKLRSADIYTLLVKGQGVAQCYVRPLWRASGDVDLLMSESNYKEAKMFLQPLACSIDDENKKRKHIGFMIDSWLVELHGTLHTRQLTRLNKVIDEVQHDVFYRGNVRTWMNGNTIVFLPSPDNDVFFVFAHIIQHYFGGGIGVRQICDWCRLLWTYKDSLNHELLESRLRRAGMMTEWKAFAAFAVDFLGMPVEAMPLYSSKRRWKKKADKVRSFVMKSGDLGKNIDGSYRAKYPYLIWKIISLGRYVRNTITHLSIFPKDSIVVLARMVFTEF